MAPKTRVFVPDFELDYGLTERVELDVDGALSLDEENGHLAGAVDPLWTCVKLGFVSEKDELDPKRAFSLGAQLGPRIPNAAHTFGTGFGAVLLGARMAPPWSLKPITASAPNSTDSAANAQHRSVTSPAESTYEKNGMRLRSVYRMGLPALGSVV